MGLPEWVVPAVVVTVREDIPVASVAPPFRAAGVVPDTVRGARRDEWSTFTHFGGSLVG